jgi:hypothetical protein
MRVLQAMAVHIMALMQSSNNGGCLHEVPVDLK